jgi:energy-coupling factor transporter ATP-binding protein EcfA2
MKATITLETELKRTARVMQIESLFDVPPSQHAAQSWEVDLPVEEKDWHIGLVVGPSGAGKSTVLRALFADDLAPPKDWSPSAALVDEFPPGMSVRDITTMLSSVGLGSIPTWTRPYRTLSTGEQFRAEVAYTLASRPELAVIDEWTSTVDRQVAKVASAATAKTVRKYGQRLIASTCHYDVEDWLNPDWVYQPHVGEFTWRSLHPRPTIALRICPVDRSAWRVFARHHYLSSQLPAGEAWGAFTETGECIAFCLYGPTVHPSPKSRSIRRAHRVVVLPDWQGLGIGPRIVEQLARYYGARRLRPRILTVHPGLIRYFLRSPRWAVVQTPRVDRLTSGKRATAGLRARQRSTRRLQIYGFEYRLGGDMSDSGHSAPAVPGDALVGQTPDPRLGVEPEAGTREATP